MLALPCIVYHQSPSRNTTRPVLPNPGDSALSIRPRPGLALASTRPRPGLDPASTLGTAQQGRKDGMARRSGSFRHLVPYNAVVSRDGRPFLGHIATVSSTGIDNTSPQDFRLPGLPLPYKRAGRALQRRQEQPETSTPRLPTQRSTSQAIISVLFFSFETWARCPLSQACNPYASTSVQGNT
jgi:hypothetical protein